ncbi:MAG: hypothetical protein IPI58_01455 [Alphaproteobacteria bacterium]|nr:MAG: hypothetical protein IPI58_01455 [Alphaproteobacteria bacterium]
MRPIRKDGGDDIPSYLDTWTKKSNPLQQRVLQLSHDLETTKRENVLLAADVCEMIQLRSELQFRKRQLSILHAKLEERDRQLLHMSILINAFYKSRSWRYSWPGRLVGRAIRSLLATYRIFDFMTRATDPVQHSKQGIPKTATQFAVNLMTPNAQEVYQSLRQRIDAVSHRDSWQSGL